MPAARPGSPRRRTPALVEGRYETAVGRAVHGVLQAIELATGDGLDQVVAAQCAAEGVVASTDIDRGCVQSALDSNVVRRAATRRHWRESFAGAVRTCAARLKRQGPLRRICREALAAPEDQKVS